MSAQTLIAAPTGREIVTPASDEKLIKQIAEGNKLAMRALFARHQVRVYRFVLRILRDSALAKTSARRWSCRINSSDFARSGPTAATRTVPAPFASLIRRASSSAYSS